MRRRGQESRDELDVREELFEVVEKQEQFLLAQEFSDRVVEWRAALRHAERVRNRGSEQLRISYGGEIDEHCAVTKLAAKLLRSHRQKRALLWRAKRGGLIRPDRFDRPEQAEFDAHRPH